MVTQFPILCDIITLPDAIFATLQGQILSYPGQPMLKLMHNLTNPKFAATEKHTETGKNARFAYGLSEMQGWRLSEFPSLLHITSSSLPCLLEKFISLNHIPCLLLIS